MILRFFGKSQLSLGLCIAASFLVGTSSPAHSAVPSGSTINLDQGSGKVEFHATGRPSALKIVGKGPAPKGALQIQGKTVTGKVHVDLSGFDTGIGLRNQHMREKYLETAKYPEAVLTVTQANLPEPLKENISQKDIPFEGKLNLHGTERPIKGKVSLDKKGKQVTLVANFDLKIGDYNIKTPGFAGVTVADDVQVSTESSAPISP